MKKILAIFLALSVILSGGWPVTEAASTTLSVAPSSVSSQVGKTFSVNINVNAGEAINSASGVVSYSSKTLSAVSVSLNGSIFSFWTDSPSVGSTISFGGGLPNPGQVGTGKIFSITFKAIAAGTGTISIGSGKALANDGKGTNVLTGTSGSTVTVSEVLSDLTITSSSHPSQSQWYKNKTLVLAWNKPSDINSFDYSLQGPSSAKTGSLTTPAISFPDLADGTWTFKLTGNSSKGNRTDSYQAKIDTQAPTTPEVTAKLTGPTDPFPVISFTASDSASGIDHYEVTVEGQATKTTSDTTIKLDRQTPGKRTVTVKAVDKAGNVSEAGSTTFTIEGFPGPKITEISRYVAVLQPVKLVGRALYGTTIHLFVDGKEVVQFTTRENLSDGQRQNGDSSKLTDSDEVEWSYFYKGVLLPGSHQFYATQVKVDTSESNQSNTVTTFVLWSYITIFHLTLPMVLVTFSLLLLLLLLIILLIWAFKRTKKAVGDWHSRLEAMKETVDDQLHSLEEKVDHHRHASEPEADQLDHDRLVGTIEEITKKIDTELDEAIEQADKDEQKPTAKPKR